MIRLPVRGSAYLLRRLAVSFVALLFALALLPSVSAANVITDENALPGNPASEWDLAGADAGDPNIQGFATDISVNHGQTIDFKISSTTTYSIKIYRIGYYNGDGARLVEDFNNASYPANVQPVPVPESVTGIVDCGAWTVSASWAVPANAVSGIYLALLTRTGGGSSHIAFVVRDDASTSQIVFKTSDTTWQAYNVFGGNSFYVGAAAGPPALNHASKISYNRPFSTRGGGGGSGSSEDWLFNAEYPMVRWLEANGYDVTYLTCVDVARAGSLLLNHSVCLSVGHDEYWSAAERASFEAARDAGKHLAFFSGNEVYWKTRWEPSTDGSDTPFRTLVCYKEGTLGENICGGKCDPLSDTWTGLWRDGCAFPAADGCRPENSLSGQISWDGSTTAIQVPDTFKDLRFWRNTGIANLGAGQTATLTPGSLGYEWDWQQYDASYPARRILLSTTVSGGHTHHLSLYRAPSGALVFGAGTVQWPWGLDSHHDRGSDAPSLDMQQATVNLFADMGAAPASLQPGLVSAVASSDAQAPSTVITSPLPGASLPSGNAVLIQGTATDAGGGVVAGVEVSVDGGATWQAANGTSAWSFAWTPVTQGAATIQSRAFDDTGNLEVPTGPANLIAVTVTAPAPPVCPCTVFQPTDTPGPEFNDGAALSLGMKFRTTVDGFITGARFYKGPSNTGTHTGLLWSSTGTLLAQAVFTGETASGWQEVLFTSPVPVTAGTTYIVAYLSSQGRYNANDVFFTAAVVNGPMRGLAFGEDGPNGVYAVGGTPIFPTSNFQTSNYWVDAVFNTTVAPDETPPTITALSPTSGASAVAVGTTVSATFSEAIDPATVTGSTFELRDPGNALVTAAVTYDTGLRKAILTPGAPLAYSTTYTATITGGGTDPRIKDVAGNALAASQVWSFTTSAPPPPPPTEGPGGPILVISAASNPFSRYPVEILRAEGLNEFTAMDISLVDVPTLAAYDVVILGNVPLNAAQVTMLSDWTDAGGTLVAFRPDAQLAPLLGLTPAAGTLSDRYLLVNNASGPGVGIVGQTIQFHGTADLYTLSGATAVATLYSDATTATPNPAVTTRNVGANGGKAIAFTYDLARSVVYTRQGNPAWAGQKRDGQIDPIRSDDQYFGPASFDPQADYVDFNKIAIPQADEQQRLLANAITLGNLHRKPLPRFWYLPKGLKAAIVETGDNHGDGGMQPRFEIYRSESPVNCSLDDWECVRATGYLYLSAPGAGFDSTLARVYSNLGFEVAVHINTNCANFTEAQYNQFLTDQLAAFQQKYPQLPPPATNRNHCIAWSGWSMTPEIESQYGIRLDTNYYYWPAAWIQNRPGMFTGSGIPMRFAKLDGTIIDCYQAATEMPDESGESFPAFSDALLNKATGPEGYYGVFTTNMHFDTADHAGSNAIVASAQAHNIPVVSAQQMLTWLDGRNGSSFGNLAWSGNTLSFAIAAASGSRNLRAMLPTIAAVGALTGITLNGSPIAYTTETIKGIEYAFFPGDAGDYVATYAVDATPPLITSVVATPHADGTATITWTTNEASTSRVDYGLAGGALNQSATDAALVTSHGVTLSGLAAETAYDFRVTSADPADNASTEPPLASSPLSFTTPAPVCFVDDTAADFGAGATGASTLVTMSANGEVTLKPSVIAEFQVLPPITDWQAFSWTSGGSATVSAGQLSVDGMRFNTEPSTSTYGPGTTIEFVATFGAAPYQHVGFGKGTDLVDNTGVFNTDPMVMFSTGNTGSAVITRILPEGGGSFVDYTIPLSLIGSAHRYRIDWKPASLDFYVDGALVHSEQPLAVTSPMRPAVSDYNVGSPALLVDWIRVTPYASSGSFVSRVYDAGTTAGWGAMTWTATIPASTTLGMFARQGATPTPDGTWTPFTAVASSGTVLGGSSRYVQYRADLATAVGASTPELASVSIGCTSGPDVTAPVISAVSATPASGGAAATISWTTDELATSRVDYGTSEGDLSLNVSNAAHVGSHALLITGLTPDTPYFYRVTSADASDNSATEPPLASSALGFTSLSPPCAVDVTAADFAAGTTGASTHVAEAGDGEVILQPAEVAEFSGVALPAGWISNVYGGSPAVVSGGQVSVDGAYAATAVSYGPGRSVEYVATFDGAAAGQHAGFGVDLNGAPWAIFSTHGGGLLEARTNDGAETNDLIPGVTLGVPHRFRIDWSASQVVYSIDGAVVATHVVPIGANMRPIVADGPTGGNPLQADWVRMTPYAASGSYTSRVFDAGGPSTWGVATWSSTAPVNTTLAMFARHGNTPAPDGSWSAFAAIPSSGTDLAATARYLQYRADLATTDAGLTPELRDVSVTCSPTSDVTPPAISNLLATPGGDGQSATVTWDTDELADSRVDYGTSAGALTSNVSSVSLVSAHLVGLTGLAPSTTYYYRVTSADASTNGATSPDPPAVPATFTTGVAPCPIDQAVADFALGTVDANTEVSLAGNGAVILKPAATYDFNGATLPVDWQSDLWGGGSTPTVSGGELTLSGGHAGTTASFGPGRSIEFVATFRGEANQHVGFTTGLGFGDPWALFSTFSSATDLYARVKGPGGTVDANISSALLGSPHRYRIDWKTSSFDFYVDGTLVTSIPQTITSDMVVNASDLPAGPLALSIDWLRMGPYATSGSFVSRVFDGLGPTNWGAVTWTAGTPAGTAVSVSARSGDTAVPDGSWSPYDLLTNGAALGSNSRYVQYKADLTSAAPGYGTPVLEDLAIACVPGPDLAPPVITDVVATPAPDGLSATVTWTTDERADSRVDYGMTPASLVLNSTDGALLRSHSLPLAGLSPGVTYYFRVTSVDASSNSATEPAPPNAPLSFSTPLQPCLADQVAADFGAGTHSGTAVSIVTDGEVILAPTLQQEFSGTGVPAGWTSVLWSGGGSGGATVAGGQLSEDGARLSPINTTGYASGRVMEFVATFGAAAYQNAGLGAGDNSLLASGMFATGAQPWVMFGTAASTTTLYARINPGGDVSLGTAYVGAPHLYRIEWRADSVLFSIDGASVSRQAPSIGGTMRPGISDFSSGGPALQVDWLRVMPYASSGTFLSRVYDAGGVASWGAMSWTATVPSGTSLAMSVRKGNTPTPDGTWTGFAPVAQSGDLVGGTGRYIQYSAAMTASLDLAQTPSLKDVGITCGACSAGAPTVIADLSAVSSVSPGNGRSNVRVTWSGTAVDDAVAVYRKDYGDYPLYRSGQGAVPTVPATPAAAVTEGWTLSSVIATGGLDAPPTRGFWYYVAFVTNACSAVSGPSNRTAGTLDYQLGDVSDGNAACTGGSEAGDGVVNTADMSAFGGAYGATFPTTDDRICLDVGPTVDFGIRSRPAPDQALNFEDLVIYALNYQIPLPAGQTAPVAARAVAPATDGARDALWVSAPAEVKAGQLFDAIVRYRGAGSVHAVSAKLAWDPALAQVTGQDGGELLIGAGGLALSPAPGTVDAAVLGGSASGFTGEGDLALVHFRARADGAPGVRVASASARDGANQAVTLALDGAPAPVVQLATGIGRVFPNPFQGSLNVPFALARESRVTVTIFDLAGRIVRHLEDGVRPAGSHAVIWDGRTDRGVQAASGLYAVKFKAGNVDQTRRVMLIR